MFFLGRNKNIVMPLNFGLQHSLKIKLIIYILDLLKTAHFQYIHSCPSTFLVTYSRKHREETV